MRSRRIALVLASLFFLLAARHREEAQRQSRRSATSTDSGVGEALRGRFNEALNEKIEDLRSGRYNQITVRVKKGASFWLTPSEDQKEALLVWVPRVGGVELVFDGKVDPKIPVYVLSPEGALAPMDKTTRPSWLVGRSNIYEAGGGSLSSERKRARLLTRCE
jgi:hypothetical protein